MNKNLLSVILAVVVVVALAEAAYIYKLRGQRASLAAALGQVVAQANAAQSQTGSQPTPSP